MQKSSRLDGPGKEKQRGRGLVTDAGASRVRRASRASGGRWQVGLLITDAAGDFVPVPNGSEKRTEITYISSSWGRVRRPMVA